MNITGIICEYNPLHLGHKKQLDLIRAHSPEGGIVCLMSGNFVQRGHPAVFDKLTRAKAALLSGADLVLELPLNAALSSAEGFAQGGVRILGGFCDSLCFGGETGDKQALMGLAEALLSPDFREILKKELETGCSFPAARQNALEAMGMDAAILESPNNILAVEYCKAILQQNVSMTPWPIQREGRYHDTAPDPENPSATAIRELLLRNGDWTAYVPNAAVFAGARSHTLQTGEKAILGKLRTMSEEDFAALPYGSEGLWRKFMHACRKEATLEGILSAVKSKRYTRTRLDRMVMCAFLGLTEEILSSPAPYTRVLALNEKGRQILKLARNTGEFINIGTPVDSPWQEIESRATALYGLFANEPEAPTAEADYRVFYQET